MTTATKITLARVIMIPAFMALFLLGLNWWALAIFILASLTDLVDGYVARNYNQTSDFGKFLDPLADKLLVFAAMLILVQIMVKLVEAFPALLFLPLVECTITIIRKTD